MENAAELRITGSGEILEGTHQSLRDIQGAGRIAYLIGDDRNLLAIGCQTKHGFGEIRAKGAVDPGRAQHRAIVVGFEDRLFSGEF